MRRGVAGAYFTFARFSYIDLSAVIFFVAELSDVRMDTCTLTDADLSGATLHQVTP